MEQIMDKSILQEAEEIVNGERAQAYGPALPSFSNIAKGWSVIAGSEITPQQVGLMMMWLKMCRENNKHQRDNLVDAAGYAHLVQKMEEEINGTNKKNSKEVRFPKNKPHSFCKTLGKNCFKRSCVENGCQDRNKPLINLDGSIFNPNSQKND